MVEGKASMRSRTHRDVGRATMGSLGWQYGEVKSSSQRGEGNGGVAIPGVMMLRWEGEVSTRRREPRRFWSM